MTHSYNSVFEEHGKRLDRLINIKSLPSLKQLYENAEAELVAKILRAIKVGHKDTYTLQINKLALIQIRQGQQKIAKAMAKLLGQQSQGAQVQSLKNLITDIKVMEKHFSGIEMALPIQESARFAGIVDARRTSLMVQHQSSMNRYGGHLVGVMEKQLALSLMTGETTYEALKRLESVARIEWWRAERIARTELAWAYNATHNDGINAATEELPDMMKRWSEHVDDNTGKALDKRVANDSIVLHGQLAFPSGNFTMPSDKTVPNKIWGMKWLFPPNRPHDRAVCAPWRAHWGIPGWLLIDGKRVEAHEYFRRQRAEG